jgi:uncharacterized membrane protein
MNGGSWLHGAMMGVHIAAGLVALVSGATAVALPKGGGGHRLAGSGFVGAMLVLGVTAAVLGPLRPEPESPLGGLLVCYFVLTAWVAARRRDGGTGLFERLACLFALGGGAVTLWAGLAGKATTPAGPGPIFVFAAVCLLAGLLDLNAILRRSLTRAQRLSRHVWRICVAFFMATGSFFLGQQDVMPDAVRRSLWLLVPALAPLAVMIVWLARLRFARAMVRLTPRPCAANAAIVPQPQHQA